MANPESQLKNPGKQATCLPGEVALKTAEGHRPSDESVSVQKDLTVLKATDEHAGAMRWL